MSSTSDPSIPVPSYTTSTNLGPLPTTTFPADCLESLFDFHTPGFGLPWTYNTQGCAISTCCPSENFYTEPWAWMTSYYSPGVCPADYRRCAPPPTSLETEAGETVAFCCPNGYNCPPTELGSIYGACFSLLSTSTEVVVLNDIFSQETESKRPFTLAPGMPNSWQIAYPIQVRSKSGDTFDEMETSSGGGAGTVGGGSGNGSGGRLSTGAIVGIVFGALAMVGLFVLAAFFLLLRKRRAAQGPAEGPRIWPAQGYIPGYGPGYAPGYAQPGMAPQWKPPMEGVPQGPVPAVHELNPSAHVAPELHSTPALHPVNPVHEMGPNVRPPELGTGPL